MIDRNLVPRIVCLALLWPMGVTVVARAEDWTWQAEPNTSLALKHGDRVVWQFHYGSDAPKPFFDPVALPDGPNVTWNQPPDHPWHHGLWFSWKYLNGVNYWEPDRSTGKPAGQTKWSNVQITTRPDRTATIAMNLIYGPAGAEPVLVETRTIDVSAPDKDRPYSFDWTCVFAAVGQDVTLDRTPLPGEPGGKGFGGYAGLSLRLAKQLTDRAADSTEGPVPFNAQSRYRGKATALDYHGRIGEKAVGVAVCDHPENLNHPSPWYVIRTPTMSYFSPAVICYGPHTLKAGQTMILRYRVIIHAEAWNAAQLKRAYQQFVQ